ncbi:MAG: efflux RND transporter permease subunit [Chthoniobacteraceae bacterium]
MRRLEEGILTGAGEIALPALVSTLCICIVFVPMFFLSGVAKYLFVPLAEAVVFAMLASYVLSRTLVPTLVMYLLRSVHGKEHNPANSKNVFVRFQRGFEERFERFRYRYAGILRGCLHHRGLVCLAAIVFFAATTLLIRFLGQDFFPSVDAGQIALHFRGKSGTRIEETARLADYIDAEIKKIIPPEDLGEIVDNLGVPISGINLSYSNTGVIGPADGDILVSLKEGHKRSTPSYVRELRLALARDFPGTLFYFLPADIVSQTLNFGLPAPLDIQISGRDVKSNRAIAATLASEIQKVPGAVDIRVQQPADEPRLSFAIDRTKAAELNLSTRDVANNVLLTLSGNGVVQPAFYLDPNTGVSYNISTTAPERDIFSLQSLQNIAIGQPITLSADQPGAQAGQLLQNVVSFQRTMGPTVVSHFNVLPVIDIYGSVSGRDLGGVMQDIQPLIDKTKQSLPRGSFLTTRGQVLTMQSSFLGLGLGLVCAIALVYLLLVVNFQSWTDPFIIITALPGALSGVIWMLFTTQTTLSVPSLMGAIMCLGVATANSVLLVSFARSSMEGGKDAVNAALDAGATRLRPVLMTALAMIIGMVPMALGLGEGGEQNAPLGRAVIGGLIIATATTLFFVPVVFASIHSHLRRRTQKHALAHQPHSATA